MNRVDTIDLDDATRWQAVATRDAAADGRFVYGVRTTGVYCRPSCPSRPALRHNVAFFASGAAAERAGFRACRRCRPGAPSDAERQAGRVARACRLIEAAETPPSLAALATAVGLGPHHFHRVFKAATGVTPRAYAAQRRAARLAEKVADLPHITQAVYAAGFNAASRFYAAADERLGMSPGAYRKRGAGQDIRYATSPCALGVLLVGATERGLCAILLGDDVAALVAELHARFSAAARLTEDATLARHLAPILAHLDAPGRALDLPLDIVGTAFQQRVWEALRHIPLGATRTYAEIAAAIGAPRAHRAVAAACAANALAIAIPCHRVVRGDGSLAGYRWGTARKARLIECERAAARADGAAGPAASGSRTSRSE